MKCKSDSCDNEVRGKQVFCSDKCRKRTSRTKSDNEDAPQSSKPVTPIPKHPTIIDTSGKVLKGMTDKPMRIVGTPDEPLTRQELIHRHKHAKASDAQVQAIWDRRNQQGQPACYTSPGQPIPEAI